MARSRGLLVGVWLVALAVSVMSWAQTVAPAAQIDEDILRLKATMRPESTGSTFVFHLSEARKRLASNPAESMPKVLALLNENSPQIRLNAAIVLQEMAKTTMPNKVLTAKLIESLKRCLRDQNSGVAYWGMQGLVQKTMPNAERVAAIAAGLDMDHPMLLRIEAARAAAENGLSDAVPLLVQHLVKIQQVYETQLAKRLSEGVSGAAPEFGEVPAPLDPDALPQGEVEQLIPEIVSLPEVTEVLQIGLFLEELVKPKDKPMETPFGFENTPPWNLKKCIVAAEEWLQKVETEEAATATPVP